MQMSILAELRISETNDGTRNRKSQTFVAAALRKNKCVDSDQLAIDIHERGSAVAGIGSGVALHINHRAIRIELSSRCADYTHRDRVLQCLWTTKRKHANDLPDFVVVADSKRRQTCRFDLQHREIDVLVRTDNARVNTARSTDDRLVIRLARCNCWHEDTNTLAAA